MGVRCGMSTACFYWEVYTFVLVRTARAAAPVRTCAGREHPRAALACRRRRVVPWVRGPPLGARRAPSAEAVAARNDWTGSPSAAWRARSAPAVFAPSLPSSLNVMGKMKPVGAANGAVRLTKPRVAASRTLNVWWFSVGVDDFRFPNIMGARIHCSPTGDRGGRDPAKGLEPVHAGGGRQDRAGVRGSNGVRRLARGSVASWARLWSPLGRLPVPAKWRALWLAGRHP